MATHIELQIENRPVVELKADGGVTAVIEAVKDQARVEEEVHIFERDGESIVDVDISGRGALSLVAHRCREVRVTVQFDHLRIHDSFRPSATINRVLQWAVSSKEFGLDPTQRSKANLILPGAEQPLNKDEVLAQLVHCPHCSVVLDLTLKDFTNGHC